MSVDDETADSPPQRPTFTSCSPLPQATSPSSRATPSRRCRRSSHSPTLPSTPSIPPVDPSLPLHVHSAYAFLPPLAHFFSTGFYLLPLEGAFDALPRPCARARLVLRRGCSHLYLLTDGRTRGCPPCDRLWHPYPLAADAMPLLLAMPGCCRSSARANIAISDGSREHGATSGARSASTHGTNSRLATLQLTLTSPAPIQERDCDLGRLYHPPQLRTAAHGLPRLLASQSATRSSR